MDTAKVNAIEGELDAFVAKRHEKRVREEGERPHEALWAESERRYFEAQRRARETERYEYHRGQADRLRRTMGELVAYHESEAERYLQDEPKGAA